MERILLLVLPKCVWSAYSALLRLIGSLERINTTGLCHRLQERKVTDIGNTEAPLWKWN